MILGWIFDGLSRCLSLSQIKIDEIMVEMKAIGRRRHISLLWFQKSIRKFRYAALGIPSGKGLFTSLHDGLRTGSEKIIITKLLRHTFRD